MELIGEENMTFTECHNNSMDFKYIPNEYRPVPFWSWNEMLDAEETKEQVKMMNHAGIGGFFMHARGGLQTEYMGDEWFSNITAAKDMAKKYGMYAWAYDENGWPSGFGDGTVNGKGLKYQQKYLRMSDNKPKENIIAQNGSHWFYYEVNPFYVDTLDKEVIAEFIKTAYQPYYDKYKNDIEGFFTDEPQVSRCGIPWSFVFEKEYAERYGKNISEHLEELFLPVCDYKKVRVQFWKMVTDLFSSSFCKQIYDWCDAHNMKLTGHLAIEDNFQLQLTTSGAVMPHYEYFHIPGMDWLERNVSQCLTARQVSSVAEQLGRDKVLSETFALSGHNVSFDELKGMYEWQMVQGINILCPHLEGYSMRGIRKRDFPPAMYYQQPWWNDYKCFVDAMSREGMILSKGKKSVDVLVIHPQTTAWSLFDNEKNEGLNELVSDFENFKKSLEEKHIVFHLGDETILERHGKVQGDKLIVGMQSYSYVLNPCGKILLPNTERLLTEFINNGGKYNTDIPRNDIIDRKEITYTVREFDGFKVHFFVNSSSEKYKAKVRSNGKKLNIYTGETEDFCGTHEFEPWGSLMIIDDGTQNNGDVQEENRIFLNDKCKISEPVMNVLTLDRCDYYFDGEIQEKNGYVLNITERANKLERGVHIKQDYFITAEYLPDKMHMVCETPEKFKICINGKVISNNTVGYFRDKSFKKLDISGFLQVGENVISLECEFNQSKEFFDNMKKAYVFESEKNKLAYDMEIEAIYLLGDFSVKTDGAWDKLERNAYRYTGDFILAKPQKEISIKNIEQQGFPFFCGELKLETEINISGKNPVLILDRHGVNVVRIKINNIEKSIIIGNKISLKEFCAEGRNKITITLVNNLRNMLGPHHLKIGESYSVCPSSFFKESCVWNFNPEKDWDEDYCFVETGI